MALVLDELIAKSREAGGLLTQAQDTISKMREEIMGLELELHSFQAGAPLFKRVELSELSTELSNLELTIAQKQSHPPLLFGKDRHHQQLTEMRSSADHLKSRVTELMREMEERKLELPALLHNLSMRLQQEESRAAEVLQDRAQIESAMADITRQFYEERIRPQCVTLIEARAAKNRVAFIEISPKVEKDIIAFGSQASGLQVNRCWTLYYYVMGFVCGEWSELEAAHTWLDVTDRVNGLCSAESEDHLLELAVAYNLCQTLRLWVAIGQNNPLRVVRERLGFDPLEVAERKLLFVMKNSPEGWQRKFGEEQLDHLIELRRAAKRQ